jgi:hypothetical protein
MFQLGDSFRCRFTTQAIAQGDALDLVEASDILVHLKARPARGVLVLNSHLRGRWQQETRIPLAPEEFTAPILCHLTWAGGALRLRVNGREELTYPVATERLAAAVLRLPPAIDWLPAEDEPRPEAIEAEILAADVMHVRLRLRGPAGPGPVPQGKAALLLLLDGRVVRQALPPPAGPDARAWRKVRFDLDGEVFACDGMRAEVALVHGGQRQVLAQAVLRSEFIGGIETCDETGVTGFVVNPRLPSRPVMVDVFLDGRFQGTARCDLPRPELEAFGPGYAGAGFALRFSQPAWLPPGADVAVSVLVRDTGIALAGSPWPLSRALNRAEVLALTGDGAVS